jgi:hypothetical protein
MERMERKGEDGLVDDDNGRDEAQTNRLNRKGRREICSVGQAAAT